MANDFKKDDFQKDEPVKPCISCEAVDEFVLVRRPMQEINFHPEQWRAERGQMKPRDYDGFNALYGKLESNLFERLDEPVHEFQQTMSRWTSQLKRYNTREEPWMLRLHQHLGNKNLFFRVLLTKVLQANRDALRELSEEAMPSWFKNLQGEQRTVKFDSEAQRMFRGLADQIEREITQNQFLESRNLSGMLSNMFFGRQVNRNQPYLRRLREDVLSKVQKSIEEELDAWDAENIDWVQARETNDPTQVDYPVKASGQVKKDEYFEGVLHCSHCGAVQSRTFNVKCTLKLLRSPDPRRDSISAFTITYDGPTKDLFEHLKPQVDRIWAEPLDELESRIAKAMKILETSEALHNKRVADEKEKARQQEIKALKKKLESLENNE